MQMLCFSNITIPISCTMIGAEKVAATCGVERKRPFVSCIRLNGVPILPPLLDKSTKTMAMEAKNRALQLEMQLGWTDGYREQKCAEKLAEKRREYAVSLSVQNGTCGRGPRDASEAFPQCTCGGKGRHHISRKFTSAPCLTDGSPNAVPWKSQTGSSSARRSMILPFSQSTGSTKVLRKCSSAEYLPVKWQSENKSDSECARCRCVREPDRVVVSSSQLFSSEQQRARNSKVSLPAKVRDRNGPQITYMKGGGVTSAESELSLVSASPQKNDPGDNSASDSTWAVSFYRQLFPLENEDRNFDSDSSDEVDGRQPPGTGGSGGGSHSASSDYVTARESGVVLLDVPPTPGADRSGGYRLVRQGSYVLDKPSEALLDHLKKQSTGETGLRQPVRPTKESSVQTEIDELELPDVEDETADLVASSKVSELREKLRKRFDTAMEALLVRQRAEQEALARSFLQVQQSARLQMKASAVINAAARGYLVRRLMKTKHVQDLIETMEESLKCIFELKGESLRPLRADQELYDRLLQQLTAACSTFYETFFDISTGERMKIIAADRERLKYLQLKAASLGLHSIRPATR
ncbi:uncharacterized protein LOC126109708 [Schistocerca cancellata]|uniref:uncharacterized protein LOC126109708 n=1 Tax=Schistocerca cancellata TaxID=274614 RepID=UPI002119B745|nr:uncharacterized protein LOC126109708 [Schistocerca cancellata]